MHAPSLYLDTSVIGGYYDDEFMADTRTLWKLREAGLYRFITSQLVFQEIAAAPERVRGLMRTTFTPDDVLERTAEAEELAQAYLAQKVVPATFDDDARHVAVCTVARIEYLVSWNFKHLANVRRESGFNAVNLLQGYPALRIVTPTFLIHGHDQEKDL
jgi:predicted nucleic acid-binding protein